MRCLLKITIPVDTGNKAILNGSLPTTIESILADQKPEAVYFYEENGKRTGLVVCELKDSSQIPAIAEPWFLAFDAQVEFHPAMNMQDLKNSAPGMQKAVQNHRKMGVAA
jgi:hypothetical protein